jgi:hypothetical protein
MRNYYWLTDPFIQRNNNLNDPANLQALLRQGIDATARDQRTTALYGHLTLPGTQLLVVAIDSRAVKIPQSQDPHLQKRSISTKIHDNSVQKMSVTTVEGLPLITFPLMCSISPAGTDESNCEHLITIHENGVAGGLRTLMEAPLTEPVTLVLLEDQGFRKFGFDHQIRRSFTDYQDNLQVISNGGFRYFTPCFASDLYRDNNFNPVARYQNLPGGTRHRCLTANTSSACCTKTRWVVEAQFGKESQLKLLGCSSEVPQQYLSSCGIPNFESQSALAVWLAIGDSLLFHHGTPLTHKYPTVDTYLDHGNDIRARMTQENPLSEASGIAWSRQNIFRKPRLQEQTNQGQAVQRVFLLNPQQTGMTAVTQPELSSVTLGSFQQRMVRQYGTKLRKKEVENLVWVNSDTHDQRLSAMPNPVGWIWDEIHPPNGPPGWDPILYWPWENGRMLLTFLPARMRSVPDRAVVLFYKPNNQPPMAVSPLGLRPPSLQRLICWCCGPSKNNSCPVGERLVGCCSHVATAISFTAVVPADPTALITTHRGVRLLDRSNPLQMDIATTAEVS